MYILSTFETDSGRRQAVFDKFTLLAVNKSDHFQPGFAAFYLSSFPNTTHFKIPAGILQGNLPRYYDVDFNRKYFTGGLYDYPLNPLEHHVDRSGNPKVHNVFIDVCCHFHIGSTCHIMMKTTVNMH